MAGTVYLVGAGPGAEDLLTLRALKLLERAEIVFHDALVNPDVLKHAPQARLVEVGKRCGQFSAHQTEINRKLVEAAKTCAIVVRLKGGDPMLFGRAQEEIDALNTAGIPFEVVPGVTAALAAAAELKVSLTNRGISRHVVFVTPRAASNAAPNDWITPVTRADTAAIYMGASEAALLAAQLISHGRPSNTPVVIARNVSLASSTKRCLTLAQLASLAPEDLAGPVLILLGEVYRELLSPDTDNHGS